MTISESDWARYTELQSKLNRKCGEELREYVLKTGAADEHGRIKGESIRDVEEYAAALVNKYAETSAELSAQLHDELAEAYGMEVPPAEPAAPPTIKEIQRALNGPYVENLEWAMARLVKRSAADTTLKNAMRDGAQFAWVPGGGETCAFCITLASRGWQNISQRALRRGHAEHIHANCNCNYVIRFDRETNVAGYDPDKYLEMYENAEGGTPEEKIASLRQNLNSQNREKINAQKRAAYAAKKQRETGETVREYKKIALKTSTKDTESSKIDLKHPTNPVTGAQYEEHKLSITDKQFGRKFGKHAPDYNLDQSDPESRAVFRNEIYNIVNEADERCYGDWRGYEYPVLFHIKGDDVVIESKTGEFVSILKGGISNARVKNARER